MMKLITIVYTCYFLSFMLYPLSDELKKYRVVESYEIQPGVLITPFYTATHEICEVSIEKKPYSNEGVLDLDAAISSEQIPQLFGELAPKGERGQTSERLPEGTEISKVDGCLP